MYPLCSSESHATSSRDCGRVSWLPFAPLGAFAMRATSLMPLASRFCNGNRIPRGSSASASRRTSDRRLVASGDRRRGLRRLRQGPPPVGPRPHDVRARFTRARSRWSKAPAYGRSARRANSSPLQVLDGQRIIGKHKDRFTPTSRRLFEKAPIAIQGVCSQIFPQNRLLVV